MLVMNRPAGAAGAMFGLLFALVASLAFPSPAAAVIRIVKKPPVIKHKEFDPANRPKDMPHMEVDHIAICTSDYGAGVQLGMRPSTRKQASGKFYATRVVDEVKVEL